MTEEDWVELGICWENESLNEAECEAAGYEWDASYSDWVVITDYAIGDVIEWEINIEDISDADYQVVLDIEYEGQDIISVTRNLTSYYYTCLLYTSPSPRDS